MSRIVVVGSLNADIVGRVERFGAPGETLIGQVVENFPGGKGANQAYGAARLGADVAMVGCVGDDVYGAQLLQHLSAGGVDVSPVAVRPGTTTGIAMITVDAGGQNQINVFPGANACLSPDMLDAKLIASADVVMLQLETPLETVLHAASLARGVVILDPAPARPLPAVRGWLTPNESELLTLLGEPADRRVSPTEAATLARRLQATNVIVKLGDAGALLRDPATHIAARPVTAIDTTAAGDAFNAAFAVALLEGQTPEDAVRFAVGAASLAVTRRGAQTSMPSRAELTP